MNNKKIYIFEAILFIFILLIKIFFINTNSYYKIIIAVMFPIAMLLSYKIFGFQKDRSQIKQTSVQTTLIVILLFLLLSFLSGLFFGFIENQLETSLYAIISNIYYLVLMIISEEIIRYIIAKKCYQNNKLPIIIITIIFIIMDLFLMNNGKLINGYELFLLITTSILPSVIRNVLASYLCYKISFIPGLILRLFYGIYPYIFPIYPDYGYYVISITGLLVPYLIYIFNVKYISHQEIKIKIKKSLWFLNIPITILLVFFVTLIAGTFKYQMIAIGSGSMSPAIDYGDAIIFEHLKTKKEIDTLNKGDVLVFVHNSKYVVHRITALYKDGSDVEYKTKGDNNDEEDSYVVNKNNVVGRMVFRIKYIGNPTLWFNKLLNN